MRIFFKKHTKTLLHAKIQKVKSLKSNLLEKRRLIKKLKSKAQALIVIIILLNIYIYYFSDIPNIANFLGNYCKKLIISFHYGSILRT